jgi:hypothetical protein
MTTTATATEYLTETKFRNAASKASNVPLQRKTASINMSGYLHVDHIEGDWFRVWIYEGLSISRMTEDAAYRTMARRENLIHSLYAAGFETTTLEVRTWNGKTNTVRVWRKAA